MIWGLMPAAYLKGAQVENSLLEEKIIMGSRG
jgi:hypothetical protein